MGRSNARVWTQPVRMSPSISMGMIPIQLTDCLSALECPPRLSPKPSVANLRLRHGAKSHRNNLLNGDEFVYCDSSTSIRPASSRALDELKCPESQSRKREKDGTSAPRCRAGQRRTKCRGRKARYGPIQAAAIREGLERVHNDMAHLR